MTRLRPRIAPGIESGAACTEAVGIKPWKRWQIDPFLRAPGTRLHYAASAAEALRRQARHGGRIAVWAARESPELAAAAAAQGAPLLRIEDGFLRSVGLGSNHVGGVSLVIDPLGIYFDPRRPSALENVLETGGFEPALLERAARLRRQLVELRLTKYNCGARETQAIGGNPGQRRILVPGQVEDDASIRYGAPETRTNLGLLARVREAEPDAWIVYKPHPDTEAGTRAGRVDEAAALRHADQIVREVSVTALFPSVDAVHALTSLVGFEALLRGIPVTTWGLPFYAGWGLTEDHLHIPRRTRRLSLDELVAGALILYPRYIDPGTGAPCEVERITEYLARQAGSSPRADRSALRRIARLCRGLYRSWKSRNAGSGPAERTDADAF